MHLGTVTQLKKKGAGVKETAAAGGHWGNYVLILFLCAGEGQATTKAGRIPPCCALQREM